MHENNQNSLTACRILVLLYIPLSLLLAISMLFTVQPVCFVLALLTIPLIALPKIVGRFVHTKRSYRMRLLYEITLLIWFTGCYVLRLGGRIPGYTLFAHVVLGCFLVLLGLVFPCCVLSNPTYPVHSRLCLVFSALFSVAVNTLTVLAEAAASPSAGVMDIVLRLLVSILTAAGLTALLPWLNKHRAGAFPIAAVREAVERNRKPRSTVTITSVEPLDRHGLSK